MKKILILLILIGYVPNVISISLSQDKQKVNRSVDKSKIELEQKLVEKPKGLPSSVNGTLPNSRNGLLLPGEVHISQLLPSNEKEKTPPFGANIFSGGYETERVDGLNDNYLVVPGDKLSIWIWGAVTFSDIVTVDNQGNIFLPNIGPIKVKNIPANQVNKVVTTKIKSVYTKNVEAYVNLLTVTPISIYVTGFVIRPGQYAGLATDSLLYYLKRAGGIDSERGSYRQVKIIRDGSLLSVVDLYEFINKGKYLDVNFRDNDVILVEPQQSTITVSGDVKSPFKFEFIDEVLNGAKLINLAKPYGRASHVGVTGNRLDGPFSLYLNLEDFKSFKLKDGDKVYFNNDQHAHTLDIEIIGSHLGPSYFSVDKSTKLHDLLSNIEIDKRLSDFSSIYILRESVAIKQKQVLDESLDRLERTVFFAPTSSTGEAAIRVQEAEMISQFILRARATEPEGKVIVSDNGMIANIQLEQGDKIVIPPKSDLVQVGGEVMLPQALVFNKNASLNQYISWAGGFTERADYDKVIITHANGLSKFIELNDSWLSSKENVVLNPGDKILVLPRIETKTMQAVKDITQVLYQLAVAANAIN